MTTLALPDKERLTAALEEVHDPHIPVSLRRMGMLKGVEIDDQGCVSVQLCIPCMACPGVGMLEENIRNALMEIEGVRDVRIDNGFHIPWSREMVDPDVRDMMRSYGIQI